MRSGRALVNESLDLELEERVVRDEFNESTVCNNSEWARSSSSGLSSSVGPEAIEKEDVIYMLIVIMTLLLLDTILYLNSNFNNVNNPRFKNIR